MNSSKHGPRNGHNNNVVNVYIHYIVIVSVTSVLARIRIPKLLLLKVSLPSRFSGHLNGASNGSHNSPRQNATQVFQDGPEFLFQMMYFEIR